jgi:RNase H-fold protein (predicted Holliday junction resolvase)
MHDFFVVVNLFSKWEAKHVIIGLFEMFNTSDATMAPKLQQLFNKFSRTHKIFAYVKDEDSNL